MKAAISNEIGQYLQLCEIGWWAFTCNVFRYWVLRSWKWSIYYNSVARTSTNFFLFSWTWFSWWSVLLLRCTAAADKQIRAAAAEIVDISYLVWCFPHFTFCPMGEQSPTREVNLASCRYLRPRVRTIIGYYSLPPYKLFPGGVFVAAACAGVDG